MSQGNGFTPTHKRMLEVLSDGLPHSRLEMHACLYDELGDIENIHYHISTLRKHLRKKGEDILIQIISRRPHYRHVRLLYPSAE